jgi:hypothetical protein
MGLFGFQNSLTNLQGYVFRRLTLQKKCFREFAFTPNLERRESSQLEIPHGEWMTLRKKKKGQPEGCPYEKQNRRQR